MEVILIDIYNLFLALLGALVGGFFTLLGGAIQVKLSDEKQKKENIRNMKVAVLVGLMSNRAALMNINTLEELEQIKAYKQPFFVALNQINVIFNDSEEVLRRYNEFSTFAAGPRTSEDIQIDDLLYNLVESMHTDLGMKVPNRTSFLTTMI